MPRASSAEAVAIVASVPVTTCWRGVAAQAMAAAGSSGRRPAATSRAVRSCHRRRPISTTTVPGKRATVSQSMPSEPSNVWAVTARNPRATPRCVTGIPAAAGPAMVELTPGTTSTPTPAASSSMASSPPRPKTIGSPPLRRTTR